MTDRNYGVAKGNFPRFYSNNIAACNFARFVANDVKGREVATGNRASCQWQLQKLNVKT